VFGYLSSLSRGLPSWFAFDHDIKVNKLVCEGRHVVLEAECVFADSVGCQDIVALPLTFAVQDDLLIGVFDIKVDVE